MYKLFFSFLLLGFISLTACNNNGEKNNSGGSTAKTLADSLEHEVMDGHNVGMAKYGKLTSKQNQAQRMLDSINSLPAKNMESLATQITNLNGLLSDLQSAKAGMDKWMDEFNMDSAVNNDDLRIKYLSDEKIKVTIVKEAILNSLQKADTVLKAGL